MNENVYQTKRMNPKKNNDLDDCNDSSEDDALDI